MHDSIRKSFRYAKLIGSSNDPSDLQVYSDNLLYRYIEDQLKYFPNSKRVLTEWITITGDLFDSVILRNEISISDMPPVQLSSLFGSSEESIREYCQTKKGIFYETRFALLSNKSKAVFTSWQMKTNVAVLAISNV